VFVLVDTGRVVCLFSNNIMIIFVQNIWIENVRITLPSIRLYLYSRHSSYLTSINTCRCRSHIQYLYLSGVRPKVSFFFSNVFINTCYKTEESLVTFRDCQAKPSILGKPTRSRLTVYLL
jgi:hypothetical protein